MTNMNLDIDELYNVVHSIYDDAVVSLDLGNKDVVGITVRTKWVIITHYVSWIKLEVEGVSLLIEAARIAAQQLANTAGKV